MATQVEINFLIKENFKKAEADGKRTAKTLETSFDKLGKSLTNVGNVFKGAFAAGIALKGVDAAINGVRRLSQEFGTALVEAQKQEDAINRLNVALAASGRYSKETSKELQDFASALQKTSIFADDTITETSALIQSLGQLDKEGLKTATKATLDLASALNIDLKAAALLVGKAAAGEISSFSRYGLIIQKGASATDTFANALDAINKKFGGAAASQVFTYSGAIAQATNSYGDFLEVIGQTITQNPVVISLINQTSIAFNKLEAFTKANQAAIVDFINSGLIAILNSVPTVISAFSSLAKAILISKQAIEGFLIFAVNVASGLNTLALGVSKVSDALGLTTNDVEKTNAAFKSIDITLKELNDSIIKDEERITALGTITETAINATTGFTTAIITNTASLNDRDAALKKQSDSVKILTEQQKELQAEVLKLKEVEAEATRNFEEEATNRYNFTQELILGEEAIKQEARDREIEAVTALEEQRRAMVEQAQREGLISEDIAQKKLTAINKREADARQKYDAQTKKAQIANTRSSLSAIATLTSSSNKKLFALGKAAALSNAILDGAGAVLKAYNTPFPLNVILPPLVIAATAAQLATIASAQPPALARGIDQVPSGFNNDTFAAFLSSGERVVPKNTNKQLQSFLDNEQGGSFAVMNEISLLRQDIRALANRPVTVQIGSREVFFAVQDELRGGRSFA